MNFTRERLEGMTDRELECNLARLFYRYSDDDEVRGEFICNKREPREEDPSVRGQSVPRYVTTWEGFAEAIADINAHQFDVELHCSAGRRSPTRRVVVTQWRLNEKPLGAEASHANLRRALAVATILAMGGWWYEGISPPGTHPGR